MPTTSSGGRFWRALQRRSGLPTFAHENEWRAFSDLHAEPFKGSMSIRASSISAFAMLALVLAFASSAPAATPESKPLTCEGRCERLQQNCLKRARDNRDRADCQFENHACVAKCDTK